MMKTHLKHHSLFWPAVILALGGAVWLLSDMLLPFILGLSVAYLLNPVCNALGRRGVPRGLAASIVLGLFITLVVAVFLMITPTIISQISHFATQIPSYIDSLRGEVQQHWQWLNRHIPDEDMVKLRDAVSGYADQAAKAALSILEGVWHGGTAFFDLVSLIFIMPIVAFYLLRDWPKIVIWTEGVLPRRYAPIIQEQLRAIDRTLAGFLRGQSTVCLILAVYFATALSFAGLNFAILIGLLTGALSFMPFVGSTFGLIAALLVAFLQFDSYTPIMIIAGIFAVAQFVEGNFITPKLVGESVGLHPIWIIFALMAGGSLLGFLGLLLAVPVAAIIGVLLRFALSHYYQSRYYTGRNAQITLRRVKPL